MLDWKMDNYLPRDINNVMKCDEIYINLEQSTDVQIIMLLQNIKCSFY